jgi:hypothetical protein
VTELKDVVAVAGSIVSVGSGVGTAWLGRASWRLPTQTRYAQRVVGTLLAGIAIALMWTQWNDAKHADSLVTAAIVLVVAAFVFLCLFLWLDGTRAYEVKVSKTKTEKVIGGFSLTGEAAEDYEKTGRPDMQKFLAGHQYNPDLVWKRGSRQLAELLLLVCFLGMTTCGTCALGAVAIRVGIEGA